MRNLSTKGLSMSQAQSISNLCNQRAQAIADQIESINNASKTLSHEGTQYTQVEGVSMPTDIIDLIIMKGKLHSTQAFLMETIKSKNNELDRLRNMSFNYSIDSPKRDFIPNPDLENTVTDQWGWDQLTDAELSEYLEAEAYASHIGLFIHKKGKLDKLRSELSIIPSIEWITIKDGEKTPVRITKHHTTIELNKLHETLAAKHRAYEQRVNYFKAKVLNAVSDENVAIHTRNAAVISKYNAENSILDDKYSVVYSKWVSDRQKEDNLFETKREKSIKETAGLRINVDSRFQDVIDMFLVAE